MHPSSHLTVLTGASRGMGLAMARQLIEQGHALLTLSRQPAAELETLARQHETELTQWACDLSDPLPVAHALREWLAKRPQPASGVTLINNAGVIPPIVPLAASQPTSLSSALRVGLEAPMTLTAAFLAATQTWAVPRKVLNISSGLGRRPMASQSAYCAAKAGLDHFTRCLALDEAALPNGARVCSLAPGVIDTDMQRQLRTSPAHDFPDQKNFEALHAQGRLSSPEQAAQQVLAYLNRTDFGSLPVADVRAP